MNTASKRHSLLSLCWPKSLYSNNMEPLSVGVAAGLAVASCGLLTLSLLGPSSVGLIASIGASALLIFALPSSPLAQPWPVLAGNILSALVGILCALSSLPPILAAALAVVIAIILMFYSRCLHPPSGALALSTALTCTTQVDWSVSLIMLPVIFNSLAILVTGLVFNRALGRYYPHKVGQPETRSSTRKLSLSAEQLAQILKQQHEVVDISDESLLSLLQQIEQQKLSQHYTYSLCRDLMSADTLVLNYDQRLAEALQLMLMEKCSLAPVVDAEQRLVGMLELHQCCLEVPQWWDGEPRRVGDYLQLAPLGIRETRPVIEIVPLYQNSNVLLPIVNDAGLLVGVIESVDILVWLSHRCYESLTDPWLQAS